MTVTNPTSSPLTKSALWARLCSVAHGDVADGTQLLWSVESGWDAGCALEPDARQLLEIFGPLLGPLPSDRPLVIGHLAQSLDGCIAREDGESHWISGEHDLDHTHRLRAICDVVIVGAETVAKDDCQLSVRRVPGHDPLRLVLDPGARLNSNRKLFQATGGPTLWLVSDDCDTLESPHEQVEVIRTKSADGCFDLEAVLSILSARGHKRVFVEGGGITISHFLRAGLMDRLHLAMAPVLIGGGRPTIARALGVDLASCPRPAVSIFPMGEDWLFDCAFDTHIS